MNLQEFSQKIKEKYPQYKNIDDTELANKILEKYPQYKNQITETLPKETATEKPSLLKKIGGTVSDIAKKTIGAISPTANIAMQYKPTEKLFSKAVAGSAKMGEESFKPFVTPFAMASGKDITLPLGTKVKSSPTPGESLLLAGETALTATGLRSGAKIASKVATQSEKKAVQAIHDIVSPVLSKKQTISALKKTGGEKASLFTKAVVQNTAKEKEMFKLAEKIVNPKSSMVENVSNVKNALVNEAQNARSMLKNNDVIFNTGELKNYLKDVELPSTIKRDSYLQGVYDDVLNKFLDTMKSKPNKISSVLDARQELDRIIEEEVPNMWKSERLSPLKKAFITLRRQANDFVSKKAGDKLGTAFKQSLRDQTLMYDMLDNVSEKAYKEIGKTTIQSAINKKPTLKKVGKIIAPYVAGGTAVGIGSGLLGD